jgi:hypothetical protein
VKANETRNSAVTNSFLLSPELGLFGIVSRRLEEPLMWLLFSSE